MVKNSVLLLLHPSKWHVEEQRRLKMKKYHRDRDPVWLLATQPYPEECSLTLGHILFTNAQHDKHVLYQM